MNDDDITKDLDALHESGMDWIDDLRAVLQHTYALANAYRQECIRLQGEVETWKMKAAGLQTEKENWKMKAADVTAQLNEVRDQLKDARDQITARDRITSDYRLIENKINELNNTVKTLSGGNAVGGQINLRDIKRSIDELKQSQVKTENVTPAVKPKSAAAFVESRSAAESEESVKEAAAPAVSPAVDSVSATDLEGSKEGTPEAGSDSAADLEEADTLEPVEINVDCDTTDMF